MNGDPGDTNGCKPTLCESSIINRLLEAGCAVMNGNAFGIDHAMRITLWNDQNKLDKMKDIFNKAL